MDTERKPEKREQTDGTNPEKTPETTIPNAPEIPDPPVPNRAWTEMKRGRDIDDLTPEERSDLYIGRDRLL